MQRAKIIIATGMVLAGLFVIGFVTPKAEAGGSDCMLTVYNNTGAPLQVWVDGWNQGALRAGTNGTTYGLAPGWHTVTVRGCRGVETRSFYVGGCSRHRWEAYG